jgi:hypothetical protein
MTLAAPRQKVNGETIIRPCRTGTRSGSRARFCSSSGDRIRAGGPRSDATPHDLRRAPGPRLHPLALRSPMLRYATSGARQDDGVAQITAVFSVTGSQVNHADVGQSVEHQLHPERGEQETEHLLGTSIRFSSSLLLTCTAPRKTMMSNASTAIELASAYKVTKTTIPAGLSR